MLQVLEYTDSTKAIFDYVGKKESWKRVEDIFNDTPTGQAIKSNTTENYPVPLSLKYVYLFDFVQLQMSQPKEDLFKVLFSELNGGKWSRGII